MAGFRFLLIFIACFVVVPLAAQGQSPRAQLDQLMQQLQSKPDDDALRENIIKLAATLKPKPGLPDEVERRMVRGIAAFKAAQSTADYQDAIKEFVQATLAAPWYGDAYYNLGVAQDKAQQYDTALRSLKLALLASPRSKEIKDLTYQVEFRADQANTPEGKAQKKYGPAQQKFAALIQKLDGAVFALDGPGSFEGHPEQHEVRFYRSGRYNLLMCRARDRRYEIEPYGKRSYDWTDHSEQYVMPTNGQDEKITDRGQSSSGWNFNFRTNGSQEYFVTGSCGLAGTLSADGQTINNINPFRPVLEVLDVWHRQ